MLRLPYERSTGSESYKRREATSMAEARMYPRDIDGYMRLPYRMDVYYDDDYWAAEFPELPGLVAGHENWDGLLAAIEDAKKTYFEAAMETGRPIPEPAPRADEYSGRALIRLPKSLHRDLTLRAQREGMSFNSLVLTVLAKELGRREERTRVERWTDVAVRSVYIFGSLSQDLARTEGRAPSSRFDDPPWKTMVSGQAEAAIPTAPGSTE
jgi:antitoxin HicB